MYPTVLPLLNHLPAPGVFAQGLVTTKPFSLNFLTILGGGGLLFLIFFAEKNMLRVPVFFLC